MQELVCMEMSDKLIEYQFIGHLNLFIQDYANRILIFGYLYDEVGNYA